MVEKPDSPTKVVRTTIIYDSSFFFRSVDASIYGEFVVFFFPMYPSLLLRADDTSPALPLSYLLPPRGALRPQVSGVHQHAGHVGLVLHGGDDGHPLLRRLLRRGRAIPRSSAGGRGARVRRQRVQPHLFPGALFVCGRVCLYVCVQDCRVCRVWYSNLFSFDARVFSERGKFLSWCMIRW